MSTVGTQKPTVERDGPLDISARDFWAKPFLERDDAFETLRRDMPLSWHRPYESTLKPPDEDTPGFWAVTRYDHIREISRDAKRFCSSEGILMEDFPEIVQVATQSFLSMDGADHKRGRGVASKAFTPRNVRKMDGWIAEHARDVVDECKDKGEGDFCTLIAKEVPGRIFAHFFGAEDGSDDQAILMDAAEKMLAWDDPHAAAGRDALETYAEEAQRIQDVALEKVDDRRANPREDLVSWVVNADFEGERFDDWEVAAFFSLLGSAANDTTRHTLCHALLQFHAHPDQLELLLEDFDGRIDGAIDEVLRVGSTIQHFRRTATEDTEVGGQPIKKGEKLVLWYSSGNYDADQFAEPRKFDILREDNKHMAFGAGGPHYCIGASLGKTMVRHTLRELYTKMPDIRLSGDPQFQIGNFVHGVHSIPVAWTPPSS